MKTQPCNNITKTRAHVCVNECLEALIKARNKDTFTNQASHGLNWFSNVSTSA